MYGPYIRSLKGWDSNRDGLSTPTTTLIGIRGPSKSRFLQESQPLVGKVADISPTCRRHVGRHDICRDIWDDRQNVTTQTIIVVDDQYVGKVTFLRSPCFYTMNDVHCIFHCYSYQPGLVRCIQRTIALTLSVLIVKDGGYVIPHIISMLLYQVRTLQSSHSATIKMRQSSHRLQ